MAKNSVWDSLKLVIEKAEKLDDLLTNHKSTDILEVIELAKSARGDIDNVITQMSRFLCEGD